MTSSLNRKIVTSRGSSNLRSCAAVVKHDLVKVQEELKVTYPMCGVKTIME